jgi:uncharacterized membrane protein YeaQ/YmgE (transglycosylase-associated protein family)
MRATDPVLSLLIIIVIGIVAGLIYDRFMGPGWLTRQVAGSMRGIATSSLIGIAGAFLGFNIAVIVGLIGLGAYIGAIIGAALVLFAWRTIG